MNILEAKRVFNNSIEYSALTGCWLWVKRQRKGYGEYRQSISGKRYKFAAHRLAWILYKGDIPNNLFVLHKCDTPLCVNPDHLWLGTQLDNVRDCRIKQRRHIHECKDCGAKFGG